MNAGSILRGGLWHMTSRVVLQLYTLVTSVVAARVLGAEGTGRLSFIGFVALSVTWVLSSSMWVALVRYIGEANGRGDAAAVRGLLAWVWRVQGLIAIGGGLGLVAAAYAGADPGGAWVLAGAITTASILHTVPIAILTGLQQFKQASILGLATGFAGTASIVAVLAAGGGIVGIFAVELVVVLVNLVWTAALARRALVRIAPERQPAGPLRRQVTRYAIGYTTVVLLDLIVARRSELFFLERFSSDEEIAFYSIAFAMVLAGSQIPLALAAVTLPAFATLFGAGAREQISTGFNRGLRLLLVFSLPLTAVGFALGPILVRVVYGDEFREVSAPLLILLASFPLLSIAALANAVLTGLGRLRSVIGVTTVAAAVDVALAVTLTGPFDARGAAVANLSAQVVYATGLLVYTLRLVGREPLDSAIVRSAAVSAIAGAAGWFTQDAIGGAAGLMAGAGAIAVAFAILAPTLRLIPGQDADWLRNALGPRLPWLGGLIRRCAGAAAPSP